MTEKQTGAALKRKMKRSLDGRILKNTTLNILVLVVICCAIMGLSMQSLANSILLDSLQPMVRQSSKNLEANIHMLADRMMTIAGDSRMSPVVTGKTPTAQPHADATMKNREAVLTQAAEIYELHTIALYDTKGHLLQGIDSAPENLDSAFLSLLQETDNLTIHSSTIFQDALGITMGMPVKEGEETSLYVVGVYKYDALNDAISSINLGKNGMAYMVNREEIITGHPDQSLVLKENTLSQISDGNEDAISLDDHWGNRLHRIPHRRKKYAGGLLSHPGHAMVPGHSGSKIRLQPYD